MKPSRGFTLVEILVVVVIVGLMAGIAVLAIGGDPSRQLKQESQRIQAVLQLAIDEALIQGQEYGLQLTSRSYQVLRFDDDTEQWLAASQEAFDPYELPGDISLSLESEGTRVDLSRLGKSEEELETIQRQEKKGSLKPSLLVLSSGEVTPFTIRLQSPDAERQLRLIGDGLGDIRVGDLHDS